MDTTNATVLQLCCYVSCGILNDICMKHSETLKTKNSGTKKTNAAILLKVIWDIADLDL